jgi:hypothetical protein
MGQGPDYQSMSYGQVVSGMNVCYTGGESNGWQLGEGYRSEAGNIGAYKTVMGRTLLEQGHMNYIDEGHYTREDMRRITLWLDMSAPRYGTYMNPGAEERGELVWPYHDVDPDNPLGVEFDRPQRDNATAIREIEQGKYSRSACSRPKLRIRMEGGRILVHIPESDPGGLLLMSKPDGRTVFRRSGLWKGENNIEAPGPGSGIYIIQVRAGKARLSRTVYIQ